MEGFEQEREEMDEDEANYWISKFESGKLHPNDRSKLWRARQLLMRQAFDIMKGFDET